MGSVRDGPKKTAVNPNVPQLLLSSFDRPPEKQKRERARLRGNITRSLRSNSPLKKIQLRSWFLHRRCSCALLRSMHDWIYHKENKSLLSSCSSSYQLRPM
ncbi:unnamed protein product [Brassica rapa subsp. trilocularis]